MVREYKGRTAESLYTRQFESAQNRYRDPILSKNGRTLIRDTKKASLKNHNI